MRVYASICVGVRVGTFTYKTLAVANAGIARI